MPMRSFLSQIVPVMCLGLLFGCGGTSPTPQSDSTNAVAEPDPHDVPITEADVQMPASYAEAIPRIKSYRDSIRSESQGATPAKAHRALDELDIVLNKLPALARDSGVPKERWETVNTTSREIRDLFNQVHSAIDEKRKPDYGAVSAAIEAAIGRLEAIATPAPTSQP
jgi:hypothetical protein